MERPAEIGAAAREAIASAPPSPSPFATLSVSGLFGLFVVVLCMLAVVGLVVLPEQYRPDGGVLIMVLAVVVGLPAVIRGYQTGLSWRRLFGSWPTPSELALTSAVVPVIVLTLASGYLVYVPLSYVAPDFVRRMLLESTTFDAKTLGEWLVLVLGAAVLIPVAEEVVFRGIILQRWAYRWGTRTGVIASSALFALGHGEWVGHFLGGMMMSLLYLRTRRLWVPIVAHALNNFIVALPILWELLAHQPDGPPETLESVRAGAWLGWPLLGAGLVLGWIYLRLLWPNGAVRAALRGPVPYEHPLQAAVHRGTG